ncbi:MAG: hypothetical protein IT381_31835 [Deltaproteobacteria bacterium]|nr:hypothetical protein [Deltaproteobacteria bacterium]
MLADINIALIVLRNVPFALFSLSPKAMQQDVAFTAKVRATIGDDADRVWFEDVLTATWPEIYAAEPSLIISRCKAQDHAVPPIVAELQKLKDTNPATFKKLGQRLKAAQILRPERFTNLAQLERVLSDSEAPANDPRPVVVIIGPITDWNGALDTIGAAVVAPYLEKYRVIYRDAAIDLQLVLQCEGATATTRADDIVLCGHGQEELLQLDARLGPDGSLDIGDAQLFARLGKCLKPGGKIALLSCSTGKGADTYVAKP